MVGPDETDPTKYGASAFDFAHSGCSWCHPGGGPLEYDRNGERYDDPAHDATYSANNPGDYYSFNSANGPSYLSDNLAGWQSGGVAEADCMMCHFSKPFNNQARNLAAVGPKAPKLGPTFGLARVASNPDAIVTIPDEGTATTMTSTAGWSYRKYTIDDTDIAKEAPKENCAICHFADKSNMTLGPSDNMAGNDAGTPFGYTAFQKRANMVDGDDGVTKMMAFHKGRVELGKRAEVLNDNSAVKDVHMTSLGAPYGNHNCSFCHVTVEGDIGPQMAPDGTCSTAGTACGYDADCPTGETCVGATMINPALTGVEKIDHQFAKGHNLPDGKNMDQLDNTVTCASCHTLQGTSREHPNAAGAPVPVHANFPASHLVRIDCRTCHIPGVSGFKKKLIADFTTTQYPDGGIERAQAVKATSGAVFPGGKYKPLLIWQASSYFGGDYQITPVATMLGAQWFERGGTYYSKRFPAAAARNFRATQGGSGTALDPYTWKLNSPQGGDIALLVNTTTEIVGMVNQLENVVPDHSKLNNAQIKFTFGIFNISHNVLPKEQALGANGCTDCHSESSNFFTRTHTLFLQPNDQGVGMQMTCENEDCTPGTCDVGGTDTCVGGSLAGAACVNNGDCDPRLVAGAVTFQNADGGAIPIDLTAGRNHGDAIANTLNQGTILGFNEGYLRALQLPPRASANEVNYYATANVTRDTITSYEVDFNASASKCGVFECDEVTSLCTGGVNAGNACEDYTDCPVACDTFAWTFTDLSGNSIGSASGPVVSFNTGNGNTYRAKLTVSSSSDPSGYTKSTTKLAAGAEVVTPTGPAASGSAQSGATPASITIADNTYTIISTTIDWRDGSRQRVVGAGPHDHTYAVVGPTYSAKVKILYSDAGVTKAAYFIVPLATN